MTRPPSSPTPTVAPRCLPGLTFPDFYETKREVWLLRTGFGIAPENKLVSLTWLLWALRSYRRFTLHYITNSLSSLHISSEHCTFCASLHVKTSHGRLSDKFGY